MPQMSPMNWSIIMTTMTYKSNVKSNINSTKLSWKW